MVESRVFGVRLGLESLPVSCDPRRGRVSPHRRLRSSSRVASGMWWSAQAIVALAVRYFLYRKEGGLGVLFPLCTDIHRIM